MNEALEMFTTEELVQEIRDRHRTVLCLTVKDDKRAESGLDIITRYNKGPIHELIGLAAIYQSYATNLFNEIEDNDE